MRFLIFVNSTIHRILTRKIFYYVAGNWLTTKWK